MDCLKIFFGDNEVVNGEVLVLDQTQIKPKYKFKAKKGEYHTIIMVDPDAPYPTDAKFKYFLHWIVVNNTDTIVPFSPPAPPSDSKPHRYYFYLYRQKDKIDVNSIKAPAERKSFNLADFENKYNLEDVTHIHFKTGHKIEK